MDNEEKKSSIFEWLKAIVLTLILFVLIRHFIFIPIEIDGDSMMTTLHDEDRVIVDKLTPRFQTYDRFEIVVFSIDGVRYVKRIIGLPGDQIQFEDDELYINGQMIAEPFIQDIKDHMHKYGKVTYDFTLEELYNLKEVPKGTYFVLGDNRLYSLDSRDSRIGFISEDSIEGRVKLIMFPFDRLQFIK